MHIEERTALRYKIGLLYDMQRIRIQTNGRINNPKSPIKLYEADKEFIANIGNNLDDLEKGVEKEVAKIVRDHPLWNAFLKEERGLAEKSAGVLISSIDITKSRTPSSLWLYTGLGVVPNVICSKCNHKSWQNKGFCLKQVKKDKICGNTTVPLEDKEGKIIKGRQRPILGEKLGYNSWLRSKLLGVIGPNFLKSGNPCRKTYDDYKARLEAQNWGKSKGHRHNAAIRFMVKHWLISFWTAWRELEGLEVRVPYAEEFLGKKHEK